MDLQQSVTLLAIFFGTSGFLLYVFQGLLLYPRYIPSGSRTTVQVPSKFNMNDYEEIQLQTPDNIILNSYLIWNRSNGKSSQTTLLYLHANAGNMGHRLPIAEMLFNCLSCNVFMLSYRGYGKSQGTPTETGMKIDAQTALDYIKRHPILKNTKIIVYGQSIGGAVAIHLVSKNESINALIIENTFLSIPHVIPHAAPFLKWFTWLCHQKWNSFIDIQNIHKPHVLFLSGCKDELIPQSQMKQLYHILLETRTKNPNEIKEIKDDDKSLKKQGEKYGVYWEQFDQGAHNNTCICPGYFESIQSFWKDVNK